jgi:hypothetical protein
MPLDPAALPEQADVLFLATKEGAAVAAALDALAEEDEMERVEAASLWPLGGWWRGDEETTVSRFLVSPPTAGYTMMLMSARDWHHDFAPRLSARLGCRAAYLMLHDSDVFTCHLHDGDRCTLAWLSSPAHFDLDDRPSLEGAEAAVATFAGAAVRAEDVARALAPPGRLDVDGRLAFARTHELLGLPAPPAAAYREALGEDRLSPLPALSTWQHVAYQRRDEVPDGDARGGAGAASRDLPPGVVPFRPKR